MIKNTSSQPLTLNIPDSLYQQLKQRAEQSERSIEDETLDVLAGVVPCSAQLPDDLAGDIDALNSLDDAALWDIARSRLAAEVSEEMEALHMKQQREGLSDNEQQQPAELRRQYERHLLKRAQAIALLKQRNHDVSHLVTASSGRHSASCGLTVGPAHGITTPRSGGQPSWLPPIRSPL